MSNLPKPTVLIIDDQQEDGTALERSIGEHAEVMVTMPEDFTKSHLQAADLVLVDYDLSRWKGAHAALTSPPNGLALSSVVREQISQINRNVTGVALYSGQVEKISATLPTELRGFAVARLTNLEWVFEKGNAHAATGVVSLAYAIQQLPAAWPQDAVDATQRLHGLLGLKESTPFYETAADDIGFCHPPIHELSTATHALAVVRWMAHRILPYPAFLTNQVGLAARLRIDVDEVPRLLKGRSKLAHALSEVEYKGILCDLYERQWWRSGLDDLAFQWTGGAGGIDALHAAIGRLAGQKVKFLDHDVVPAINESYRATELVAVSHALRLRLDDWPPFADDAWAERTRVAESDKLRGLVVPTDLELLDNYER
jgi:hypothetical protein